MGKISLSEHS